MKFLKLLLNKQTNIKKYIIPKRGFLANQVLIKFYNLSQYDCNFRFRPSREKYFKTPAVLTTIRG